MKVLLKKRMPFLYRGTATFYNEGAEFEVVEEKVLPIVGMCYRVRFMGFLIDGFIPKDNFK